MRFRWKFTFGGGIWMCSCSSTIYWKSHPSSIELLLHLCEKSLGCVCLDSFCICLAIFCVLSSIPPIYVFIPLMIPHCLGYFRLYGIGQWFFPLYSSFSKLFRYSRSFAFPYKFWTRPLGFYSKSPVRILTKITLHL